MSSVKNDSVTSDTQKTSAILKGALGEKQLNNLKAIADELGIDLGDWSISEVATAIVRFVAAKELQRETFNN